MRSLLTGVLAVALLVPADAAAQSAPADERASAQAFAAALAQFEADTARLKLADVLDPPACAGVRRLPRRAQNGGAALLTVAIVGGLDRKIHQPLMRFSMALHAVPTADPVLRAGRTAWRRIRRLSATMASEPRLCVSLRHFARAGYRPTPAVRSAHRLVREAERLGRRGTPARRRAARRMEALGVPRSLARRFVDPKIGGAPD